MTGVEISRWSSGAEEFIVVLGQTNREVTIERDRPAHVFDVKSRTYIGHTSAFTTSLRANRGSVFAFLQGPPTLPTVSVGQAAKRGKVTSVRVAVPGANGARAIVLTLTAPDGNVADWIQSPVIVRDKPASIPLPFAHNDPAGTWRLRAMDLYTGGLKDVPLALQ